MRSRLPHLTPALIAWIAIATTAIVTWRRASTALLQTLAAAALYVLNSG